MQPPAPFVDIHCHMLPGLDDGAASLDEAVAMAEMAAADGFGAVVVTPHQMGNYAGNRGETIRTAAAAFQEELDRRNIPLAILPGADVRIEADLLARLRSGDVVSLADRRRHVLLELPHEVYLPLDRVLADLNAAGMVGVLSHPERNLGLLRRPDVLGPLVDAGCLLQVTAGSLTGAFGSRVQAFAESLVRQGMVHFLATDAHSTRSRCPKMSAAFDRCARLAGRRTAVALCCQNPARVAVGAAIHAGRRRVEKRSWGWLPWRKAA